MPDSKRVVINGVIGPAMPSRASGAAIPCSERYEARLARCVLAGGPDAVAAAMALLEHGDPPTLDAAVALLTTAGGITEDAFDRLADAWETYRHVRHLSWD